MTSFQACDRRIIHGSHTFLDAAGLEHRCPGVDGGAPRVSWRDRINSVLGDPCSFCGKRGAHYCDLVPPAGPGTGVVLAHLVHGRLLDGTVLCPNAPLDEDPAYATVFLDLVTCQVCSGRLARIQGRPTTAAAELRALRPRARRTRKAGAA